VDMVSVIGSDVKSGFYVCKDLFFVGANYVEKSSGEPVEADEADETDETDEHVEADEADEADEDVEESSDENVEWIEEYVDDSFTDESSYLDEYLIEEYSSEYLEDDSVELIKSESSEINPYIHLNKPFGPETEEFHRFVYGYKSEDDM